MLALKRIHSRSALTILLLGTSLIAATVAAQVAPSPAAGEEGGAPPSAPPTGDAPATAADGEEAVPMPGPAAVPAVPGALPPGAIPLPQRFHVDDSGMRVVIGPIGKALDPVAIPDALCTAGRREACDLVVEVLRNDLRLSGYFKILPPASYVADMSAETLDRTRWPDWGNVGATYLIKVEVRGTGPYDLSFRLYEVVRKAVVTLEKQDRRGVSQRGLRRAVHDYCNYVVEHTSGTRGVFGTRILYAARSSLRSKGIGVVDMDGHAPHGIIGDGSVNMLPSWAPGGGVLYTSFRSGIPQLYLGKKRLTQDERQYRGARFAPGGDVIAASVDMGGQSDIWLLSPEGEPIQNLTNHWGDDVSPDWSPGGGQIVFVSNRSGNPQIFVMNRDGSGQRRLTMAGSYNTDPDWGPGGLIAFAGADGGRSDIFTVDLGGGISRLTQEQGNNRDPSWAPNGRYIAFVSDREGGNHLWIMTADGRYQFRIGRQASCSTPVWSR